MCGWRGLIGSWYEINDKLRLSYVPFTFVTTCSLRYMHVRCPPAATTACLPRDTLHIHVSDTLYPHPRGLSRREMKSRESAWRSRAATCEYDETVAWAIRVCASRFTYTRLTNTSCYTRRNNEDDRIDMSTAITSIPGSLTIEFTSLPIVQPPRYLLQSLRETPFSYSRLRVSKIMPSSI